MSSITSVSGILSTLRSSLWWNGLSPFRRNGLEDNPCSILVYLEVVVIYVVLKQNFLPQSTC